MSEETKKRTENEEAKPALEKPAIRFSPTQQKIIDSDGANVLVSASAGSGKTAVLIERLCRLIVDKRVPVSDILALTFTEDAAREMKDRLKARLSKADLDDPWVRAQLTGLETASISTIHSFCLDLLERYYYLTDLSYSTVCHVDNGLLDTQAMDEAIDTAMKRLSAKDSADLRIYLDAYSRNAQDLRSSLQRFLETARSKPDPQAWMEACRKPSDKAISFFFQYFEARVINLLTIFEGVQDVVGLGAFKTEKARQDVDAILDRKIKLLDNCLQQIRKPDYAGFARAFTEYIETSGKFMPRMIPGLNLSQKQKRSRALEAEIAKSLFTPDQFEQIQHLQRSQTDAFITLAIGVYQEFARIKKENQFIDFSDMEQYAWQILQQPEAADELRRQYQYILVDEYQDTNDLQEAIISAIARDDNVFRVGDLKQSIYGFRQARPALMASHMNKEDDTHQVIAMQENYRSTQTLVSFFNHFFHELMNVPGLPSQFKAHDIARTGTARQNESAQVPVRFLYSVYGTMEDETGKKVNGTVAKRMYKNNLYHLIAQDITQRVEKDGMALKDIAILSRTSTPHNKIKEALSEWGIRSAHHVRGGFYTNKSVQIVLSALRVIQNERNDVALMAVLCSPLTGLEASDIIPLLKDRQKGQSIYQTLMQDAKGREILSIVRRLKKLAAQPLPAMLVGIYGIRNFYTNSTTTEDKTNLDLLLAKTVDAARVMDLDEYLASSALEEDLDKTSEAAPFGREEDAVRISTIHASKGLQYKVVYLLSEQKTPNLGAKDPIVIDPDLGLSFNGLDPHYQYRQRSWSDLAFREKEWMESLQERMRLLYVACTRAEEQLIFVDTLSEAELYDDPLDLSALMEDCGFTGWFFHCFHGDKTIPVIQTDEGVRDLVEFDCHDGLIDSPKKSVSRSHAYRMSYYAHPPKTIYSMTASQSERQISWAQLTTPANGSAQSTRARTKGTLMHRILAELPYPYTEKDVVDFCRKADFELTREEIDQILALDAHPIYSKWMKEKHTFECPYVVFENGAFIHGFMDLVVEEAEKTIIVDFKTDQVFDEFTLLKRYRKQLETYKEATAKIRPDREILAYIYSFALNQLIEITPKG